MTRYTNILSIALGLLITGSLIAPISAAPPTQPQVWDFAADTLPCAQNMLSEAEINSWFGNAVPGTQSLTLRSFTASDSVNLRYYSHGATNHRLRTTRMTLTHTDEKSIKDSTGYVFRGMIYANTDSDPDIYIEQLFSRGDTIEYILASNGGPQTYRFYLSDSSYYATCHVRGGRAEHHRFVCPKDGRYRISGVDEKLVVARIIRYPLQGELTKEQARQLCKMSHHPLRHRAERPKYRADFPDTCARLRPLPYIDTLYVDKPDKLGRQGKLHRGSDPVCSFSSINEALTAVRRMRDRLPGQRVTIMIAPGNYEEMLRIDVDDVTLRNASPTPSIALRNSGVDIDENAVRITAYYGGGYNYYSMNAQAVYDPRTLKANQKHHDCAHINKGGSATTYWNAVTLVTAERFEAYDIIFENSFNQYISAKEATDVVLSQSTKPQRPKDLGSTAVQQRAYRERAAALAFARPTDATTLPLTGGIEGGSHLLHNCRLVGRQDVFYGDAGVRVLVEGGVLMGAVDYIFGGMTLVCRGTTLAMLCTEAKGDISYLTAASTPQGQHGMLFLDCTITSAIPGVEMADSVMSQPGYLGRPWASSAEVIFVRPVIEQNEQGEPLIRPELWSNSLTGKGADRLHLLSEPFSPNGDTIRVEDWLR